MVLGRDYRSGHISYFHWFDVTGLRSLGLLAASIVLGALPWSARQQSGHALHVRACGVSKTQSTLFFFMNNQALSEQQASGPELRDRTIFHNNFLIK